MNLSHGYIPLHPHHKIPLSNLGICGMSTTEACLGMLPVEQGCAELALIYCAVVNPLHKQVVLPAEDSELNTQCFDGRKKCDNLPHLLKTKKTSEENSVQECGWNGMCQK